MGWEWDSACGQDSGGAGDVSCGLAGAGTGGPRAGMGSWALGRSSRAPVCTLALTESMAGILGQYLLPVFCGNPGLHSSAKEVSQVLT